MYSVNKHALRSSLAKEGDTRGGEISHTLLLTSLNMAVVVLSVPSSDLLPAKNGEEQTVQFLLEVVDILLTYVRKTFDRSTKVLDFHHPHQLLEGMEGFNLELSDNPESLEQILVDCRDTLKYGVRTGERMPWSSVQK